MIQESDPWKIIGIFLVKNEEYTIEWAIKNSLEFCDKVIVCDNGSRDKTVEIVKQLAAENPKIEIHCIKNAKDSHSFIADYAGTKTWVFAVDGDEIYDPVGLRKLRADLLDGKFADRFKLIGYTVHLLAIDLAEGYARGYLGPPSKTVNKLYNFSILEKWVNPPYERLHGGEIEFLGVDKRDDRYHFAKDYSWEDAPLKCLHLCFLKRSPCEKSVNGRHSRKNISDLSDRKSWMHRLWKNFTFALSFRKYRSDGVSAWKEANYRSGEIQNVDCRSFIKREKLSDMAQNRITNLI